MVGLWKMLGWLTILTALLTAAPLRAGAAQGPPLPRPGPVETPTPPLVDLNKAVADLEKEIKRALTQVERDTDLRFQNVQRDLEELKRQVAQMRENVDALRKRLLAGQASTSQFGPAGVKTGRVRLVNAYLLAVTITVNEQTYRLEPGETRLADPVPAGTFTYQVLGVQPQPERRLLAPQETFTITVQPRRDGL